MTATLGRSDNFQDRMFKYIYGNMINFGKESFTSHYVVYLVNYNTYPLDYHVAMCSTKNGFNANIYFRYLFSRKEKGLFIYTIILHIIKSTLESDNTAKVLIVLSRLQDINIFYDYFKKDGIEPGRYCTLISNIKLRKKN